MDVVVTVPQGRWNAWVAEGDLPGSLWSGLFSHFTIGGARPQIVPGERVYIVAHGCLRGYAPLFAFAATDRGVNYFLLQLERAGASPIFSCEGHPHAFYIIFRSPEAFARRLLALGFFTVELDRSSSSAYSLGLPRVRSDPDRRHTLRLAAEAWERVFGPLDLEQVRREALRTPLNPTDLGPSLR